jgi:hypothetical protein
LIFSGWLAAGFVFLVIVPLGLSLGYDAYSYWSIDLADLYGRAMSSNFTLGAFRYSPPVAFLLAPLGLLPWWLYLWLWLGLMVSAVAWLGGRWALVAVALPPVTLEIYHGNIHLLMAVAIALGFRHRGRGPSPSWASSPSASDCCGSWCEGSGTNWPSRLAQRPPWRSSHSSSRPTTGSSS